MTALSEMKPGEKAKIASVFLPPETAERLRILGISGGKEIVLLKRDFFSRTYLISTSDGRVGLRRKTAQKIFLVR
ncbi:MAG: ferrous iron transport protein A [Candidatus Scatosoma sp.]